MQRPDGATVLLSAFLLVMFVAMVWLSMTTGYQG